MPARARWRGCACPRCARRRRARIRPAWLRQDLAALPPPDLILVSGTMTYWYPGVREVIDAVNRVNGSPIKVKEEERRAGDPPALIAKADKARDVLGWEPSYDDLDFIVKTSLDWERKQFEQNN